MNPRKVLIQKRSRRIARTRARISGTADTPRLCVFRSNKFIYVQLVDDEKRHTVCVASSRGLAGEDQKKPKLQQAQIIGELLAKRASGAGVQRAVFDRRGYKYHGRVKAIAEGARQGGLVI